MGTLWSNHPPLVDYPLDDYSPNNIKSLMMLVCVWTKWKHGEIQSQKLTVLHVKLKKCFHNNGVEKLYY